MSKTVDATLHLEWSPGHVRALDRATGKSTAAQAIGELGPALHGHKNVLVGVGRSSIFLKTLGLPRATPEDLRNLLGVRLGQLFPLPASELAFDFLQTDAPTPDGFLTVVAAMRSKDLLQLRAELSQAGLKATAIRPVALGAAVAAKDAGLPDALVVESVGEGLTLDVIQGGVLRFSRTTPGGDVVAEAQRTIAAAGVDRLPTLETQARDASRSSLGRLGESPAFHFALSDDRLKEQKDKLAGRTRLAGLMLLSGVLLATLIGVDRADDAAAVKKAEGKWARELTQLRSTRALETKKAQEATAQNETLTRAFQPAQPLSDVTSAISDALPQNVWLTGLNVERGKPVQLRGTATRADDVAKLVGALSGNPRFRDVRLVFANGAKIRETPIVQFNLSATAVGNLPLPEAPKGKKGARPAAKAKTTEEAK